ncbi:leucine-rich repeat-containing protein 53 isoform X2 [Hyla sarda]|uniref:leucine-rich repeat-containing protein 53 isoform X2 n=1 Tax=Hyla sarda TaxID=327740 RepID=UPI0024C39D11|nr:leucine-rich repeat-containing protein 53 isoform X2 [Hyla sarda]
MMGYCVIVLLLGSSFYLVESCPSSCVVCSEETTICQGLPYIIALPSSTKVLVITEGDISLIGLNNFSHLFDLSLLRLSGNKIKKIQNGAFTNLTKLRTLVLDYNQISSTSITNGTFFPLQNLETLQLNRNDFGSIDKTWFGNTERLIRLEINRNQITSLTRNSLGSNALHKLQHLDLSSNFISFIQERTFESLRQLKELDLSKNRLTKLPDVFSFLPHLTLLNIGHNEWNCSCGLHQLADFLRNYTYSTKRKLIRRSHLLCSYSSNPAVISLLQLTDRNCGSRSYNITVITREKTRGSTREGLLIAILVITGFIALSFLIILIAKCTVKPKKPNERGPTRCSCGEAQQFPRLRVPVHKIDLTQEGLGDVMSSVHSPRIDKPCLKKHTGSLPLGCNVPESVKSLRGSSTQSLPGRYYICLGCRLVQWRPPSPTAMFDTNEVGCISNSIQRIPDNPKDFVHAAPWEGANTTVLQELSRFNKGETSIRRPFLPKDDMMRIKPDNIPKPDMYYNLPEKSHINMGPYKQNADVMSRLTTKGSVEMKMHAARPPLCAHRSQRGGPSVLLSERKDISSQTDNDLICKYMESDKLEEPRRQITEPETQNVKFEEQKIQTHVTEENCFLNNDSMLLSARIRKVNIPKSVGFYIPHIQHKSDMAVNTPQSRQEQLCRPHLGSKYLLTINNKDYEARQASYTSTLVDTLKDVYINGNMMYTRRVQDYLRVKVNLQPFRKVRVHPQKNMEATKRGQSPKRLRPQSPRKKLRSCNSSLSSGETKVKKQMETVESKPSPVDHPSMLGIDSKDCSSSKAKDVHDKKSMGKSDNGNDISGKAAMTPFKERGDTIEGLPSGTVEDSLPNVLEDQGSKTAFNSLKSERTLSLEQSQNPSQLKDPEIHGESEELTESKLQTQLESQDNARALCGNVLDPTPSNVTGISEGTDSTACGNNINCEIDIAGSSLPGNKVNGHLEGYRKDDIAEAGHLPRPDNSIKNTTINEDTDREMKGANDSSPDDSKADETGHLEGCEKEDVHSDRNAKVTDHEDHGKIFSASSLQSTPGRDDPPLSTVIDLQRNINQQVEETGIQDHKLDEINVTQQSVETEPDLPLKSHQSRETGSSIKNEVPLMPRQNNEAPEGPAAHTSVLPAQQNNANNNHSKASAKSGRKHLSLSDSSKVIIVVESLNETINIQKYLSERRARHHTWQTTNYPGTENDSASGDGSQKKKICLILPEKSGVRDPKLSSKKIK